MKIKPNKNTSLSIFALITILIAHAAERCIALFMTPTLKLGMILALAMTVLLCVVIAVLTKTNDSFTGLLAALIGYKMMPPSIAFLGEFSPDGAILYYLMTRAANLIFIILVFRLYNMQERPRRITALPLCAMLFAVPFTNGVAATLTTYFLQKTGSMLGGYLAQYACYAAASLGILALAFVSTYTTMRFAAYFEFTALSINVLRTIAKIAYRMINELHVSKSLYGWLILYIALIVIFFLFKIIKKKNVYNI